MRYAKRAGIAALAAAVLWLAAAQPARAGIVFNNFTPGDHYNTSQTYSVSRNAAGTTVDSAMAFTPSSTVTLDSIALAVSLISGANQLTVTINANDSSVPNGRPGAVLETFSFTNAMASLGTDQHPLTANSVLHPLLMAGKQFWLVASAPAVTQAGWNLNIIPQPPPRPPGQRGLVASRTTPPGNWSVSNAVQGAFRIQGSAPVPEPMSLALMGIGTLGLIGYRRFRSR